VLYYLASPFNFAAPKLGIVSMANMDIALNPTNGVFRDLDKSITNNVIFRSFINRIELDKLEDASFVSFIKKVSNPDEALLTSVEFTTNLASINDRGKSILKNERFTGAVEAMRPDFLRSSSFRTFADSLNFSLLAQENDQFSFSGKLRGGYFTVLSRSFTASTLQDESFNDFLNKTNVGDLLRNSNFLKLIDSIPAFVWQDSDFTIPLVRFSTEVLTNSKFVDDVQKLSYEALTTTAFKDLLSKFTSVDLVKSGSQYVSIVANGSPLLKGAKRDTYGLRNPGFVSGGRIEDGSSREKAVGFREIRNTNISSGSQTWVIIHGYDDNADEETTQFPLQQSVLRNAGPNDRILALDWREPANSQRFDIGNFISATWSTPVAEYVKKTLNDVYGVSSNSAKDTVNLVGHSLGAYVAGEIGKIYKNVNGIGVRTITALDPASSANNLIAVDVNNLGGDPYDMDGRIAGSQAPQDFSAVSRFSRAFNGTGV
jgi:pimeloyl-ACP methyl ester carboxylesterase